jgi:hypothetical protein
MEVVLTRAYVHTVMAACDRSPLHVADHTDAGRHARARP